MIENVEIGRTTYLEDGAKATITVINPLKIHLNLDRVALAEASHAVIDPNNTDFISGNVTKVRSINSVQAAAHAGDGDSHDRAVTNLSGGSYDAAIPIARRILNERSNQVVALASFLMDNGGNATRGEIFDVIDRAEQGPELEIAITSATGEREVITEKAETGEVIIVNFMNGQATETFQELTLVNAA